MKFLDRDGDGPEAKYGNRPEGAMFLDAASPRYIGGILVMLNARLFKFLERSARGAANGQTSERGEARTRINFEAFAEKFDFSRFRTLCDVGGATGLLSIEVAKRHSHLRRITFDLPVVEPIAKKHIAAAGLADRVTTVSGDFFKEPLPKADLITMGMILHDWNLENKLHLIRSIYEALPPGEALVAIEALIDDARRENVQGLLMSLNMLIEFGDAFDYSGADFRRWCREVGFTRFDVIHLVGPSSAAVAYKCPLHYPAHLHFCDSPTDRLHQYKEGGAVVVSIRHMTPVTFLPVRRVSTPASLAGRHGQCFTHHVAQTLSYPRIALR
ncbi:MAG: methyltransferase [Nitrospira sp.]